VFIINKEEKFIYVDVENDLRSPVARIIREEMMIKACTNLRILTILFSPLQVTKR
jgi:hypothetical protein